MFDKTIDGSVRGWEAHYLALAMCTILPTVASGSNADSILYDNNVLSSDVAQVVISDISGSTFNDQRVAEDFVLVHTSNVVDEVRFLGVYTRPESESPATTTPPATDNFTFTFFDDLGGIPDKDSVIATVAVGSANRTDTGADFISGNNTHDIFSYSANISQLFFNPVTYHVSVVNDTNDIDDSWAWAGKSGVSFSASSNVTGNNWFQIMGPGSYTPALILVPEPSTASLGLGFLLLGSVRDRRRTP